MPTLILSQNFGILLKRAEQHTIITNTLPPNPPAHTRRHPPSYTRGFLVKSTSSAYYHAVYGESLRNYMHIMKYGPPFPHEQQLYSSHPETVFIFLGLTGQQ